MTIIVFGFDKNVQPVIDIFPFKLKHRVQLYFMSRADFDAWVIHTYGLGYYNNIRDGFKNIYTGKLKTHDGNYDFKQDGEALYHQVVLVDQEGWEGILIHELVHCWQAEMVGICLWKMLDDILKHHRDNDPFELQAYFIQENLSKTVKKE
jgi:hypothetical protein